MHYRIVSISIAYIIVYIIKVFLSRGTEFQSNYFTGHLDIFFTFKTHYFPLVWSRDETRKCPLSCAMRNVPFSVVNRLLEGRNVSEGQISKCLAQGLNKSLQDQSLILLESNTEKLFAGWFQSKTISWWAWKRQHKLG